MIAISFPLNEAIEVKQGESFEQFAEGKQSEIGSSTTSNFISFCHFRLERMKQIKICWSKHNWSNYISFCHFRLERIKQIETLDKKTIDLIQFHFILSFLTRANETDQNCWSKHNGSNIILYHFAISDRSKWNRSKLLIKRQLI